VAGVGKNATEERHRGVDTREEWVVSDEFFGKSPLKQQSLHTDRDGEEGASAKGGLTLQGIPASGEEAKRVAAAELMLSGLPHVGSGMSDDHPNERGREARGEWCEYLAHDERAAPFRHIRGAPGAEKIRDADKQERIALWVAETKDIALHAKDDEVVVAGRVDVPVSHVGKPTEINRADDGGPAAQAGTQ